MKKTGQLVKGEKRKSSKERGKQGVRAGAERPPESAENFEHVLRRLISGRNGGSTSQGRRAD